MKVDGAPWENIEYELGSEKQKWNNRTSLIIWKLRKLSKYQNKSWIDAWEQSHKNAK